MSEGVWSLGGRGAPQLGEHAQHELQLIDAVAILVESVDEANVQLALKRLPPAGGVGG
jgi:hypothetical protein